MIPTTGAPAKQRLIRWECRSHIPDPSPQRRSPDGWNVLSDGCTHYSAHAVCPGPSSGNDYEDNIECWSTFQVSCGQQIGLSTSPLYNVLTTGGLNPRTDQGLENLIHAGGTGPGQGQDTFTPTGSGPVTIIAGANNPNFSALGSHTPASAAATPSSLFRSMMDGSTLRVQGSSARGAALIAPRPIRSSDLPSLLSQRATGTARSRRSS